MTHRPLLRRLLGLALLLPRLAGRALRAWQTLDPQDWSRLADRWQTVVDTWPRSYRARLLQARLLRTARRFPAAAAAADAALALTPGDGTALLERAKALRGAGHRTAAIASFAVAWHAGERDAAQRELCRYGARAALPEPEPGIAARADYAAFAAANPVPPAPPAARHIPFRITIAGAAADDAITRASLAEQTYPHWLFAGDGDSNADGNADAFRLSLTAGTRLDPHALAWLAWAIEDTGCDTVTADHDLLSADGTTRVAPPLRPPTDRLWSAAQATPIVAHRGSTGPAIHVPLVLASCPLPPATPAAPHHATDARPPTISVIIPTRDNPALLRMAIATLRATAATPDRLQIVIVDNGSRADDATALLAGLETDPRITIIRFDAPFNWSQANNLGAAAASGELLLFLNDDTEMRTPGWDQMLRDLLENPAIGVVGARMVYPDGTIQHGGFVFGMDNGPQHEGRWMAGDDAGPGDRWLAIREAAAVTGAFMALRRHIYQGARGFDAATFAVDFADVDFCLRVRAQGFAVAYHGGITVLHHESVSRGLNLSRAKRQRMRRETAALRRRWGAAVDDDPFYHPAWSRTGCSYDGLRRLSQTEVIDHVRRQGNAPRTPSSG